jgi:transcriptional regulator NrdR family protein
MPDDRDSHQPEVVQRWHVCEACGTRWPTALAALYCARTDDHDDG